MTALSSLREPLRSIVGDRQILGGYNYEEADLDAASRTVFVLGRQPTGYALDNANWTAAQNITPDIALGNDIACILFNAALILIAGEDGGVRTRTREVSVSDDGHRKRDLLYEIKRSLFAIEHGDAQVQSVQSFFAFCGSILPNQQFPLFGQFTNFTLNSGPTNLSL